MILLNYKLLSDRDKNASEHAELWTQEVNKERKESLSEGHWQELRGQI